MLGSEVDRNGVGGSIFDGRASWIPTGWWIRYRRRRVSFSRMARIIGGGQRDRGGQGDVARCGAFCLCDWQMQAEERANQSVSVNADRAEPVVSVCR